MLQPLLRMIRRKANPVELLSRLAPRDTQLRSLVHVGAHLAQERSRYEALGYREILWVEGSPTIYQKLEQVLAEHNGSAQHECRCALLTDKEDDQVELHQFSNQGMSNSIFKATPKKSERWPTVYETGETETVRTTTLDALLAGKPCDVLVVDVQGAELLVLNGAHNTLQNAKALICEISTVPYYEGGVLFDELAAYLKQYGFHPMSTPRRHGDMLFLRRNAGKKAA